ncbi:DUF1565 domain-containing protein [Photobacterium sp. TLY01]|uniref:DUF1565 domain-containing protein n=1 Tax=Photobacterium sp. TLY01 TaxID=2907534 RepID=UPI001F450977|nr:DUF1565 domain-containing protein [Photobacterium sp. TLY01]UIP28897.1 DUF1565 domain-containing protein [Photobacterium sp. TLY01]
MSLEQQVSALVSAANNLTSTVNGKINQIDAKVNEATAKVPEAIRKEVNKTFYIDAANGNDNYGGSEANPLRTIDKAVSLGMAGGNVTLFLRRGQEHIGPSNFMLQSAAGKLSLVIGAYGSELTRPLVKPAKSYYLDDANKVLATFARSSESRSINIAFRFVDIETASLADGEGHFADYGAFFCRGGGQEELFEFNVAFHESRITIKDTFLFGGYVGLVKLRMNKTDIVKADGAKVDKLFVGYEGRDRYPKVIDGSRVTVTGFNVQTMEHVFCISPAEKDSIYNADSIVFS